ncbi:MAG: iron ABC transporter permease, partial [Carnobacterium sp.]
MNKHKVKTSLFVGGLLLIGLILIQLNLGAIRISPLETIQTLMGNGSARNQLILFEFRLPRIVMALLVGMGLAISGAILQGITQNDLADSSILGINAGAGLGVVLYLFFSTGSTAKLGVPQFLIIPLVALGGAFFAASLIYLGAWKKGIHQLRLLLVGIAVTALLNAFILIFQLQMDEFNFEKAMVWLSGNLWNVNWSFILIISCWLAILLPLVYWFTMRLDILR